MSRMNPEQLLHAIDSVAESLGLAKKPLCMDVLLGMALRRAGRAKFRDSSFLPPLRLLLGCLETEADLNVVGRQAAKWDVLRCLSNLLRLEAEEERHPAILECPIERPIFITGLPRSGTTLLHSLLALDGSVRVPRCWQTMFPYPQRNADRRRGRVERQLRLFQRFAPDMARLHPLSADAPQECTEMTAQVFHSLRYEMTYRVPTYQAWLDRTGHTPAYLFHKRFLQHLQNQKAGDGRWILKCPDHVHALKTIETVYPDCGLVFVHRDPLRVIASAASLTEAVRRPFTRRICKGEIGRQVEGRLIEAAEAMMEYSNADTSNRIFHLHYTRFARDPVGTLEALYRHFGLELRETVRARMTTHLAGLPRRQTRYRLDEYELNADTLRTRFEPYVEFFDVARESSLWETPRTRAVPIAA